jgi:hypothetical protein
MNYEQSKVITTYLKELRRCFPVFNAPQKKFYDSIKILVEEYSTLDPDFTKTSLIANIGEPKEIVARYLLDVDTDILYKSISFSKRVRTITAIALITILTAMAIKIHFDYQNFRAAEKAYIDREIHELEEN